ncbi:MAG: type II toxin-antitoxin system PemK/MazF family toxin [Candidatus Vogelbacteria bacterium]|nr:type II toxin-antitoxin system PemK/MazF family toxin [Candidatus Vogelbacteria bacterium]
MEEKNYKNWHPLKSRINNEPDENRLFFHEREVWYCHMGENIGSEQDGRGEYFLRPVIIFKKFNNEIFWGIPLTKSSEHSNPESSRYYFNFSFLPEITSSAILSQIRLTDGKRLVRCIGMIEEKDFMELTKKFKGLIP